MSREVGFRHIGSFESGISESWDRRFLITRRTDGVNLVDRQTGEILRFTHLPAARAVADLRAGIPADRLQTHHALRMARFS